MEMTEPVFEIAERRDIDLLLEMMREYYAHDGLSFETDAARSAMECLVTDRSLGRVWVIRAGREAIGYVAMTLGYSLEYHGKDAFIDEIYIRASHRGQGIGERAVRFVEDACRETGVRALHLEVERANTLAQSFYRRIGFEDHHRYMMTRMISQTDRIT